MKIRLTRRTGEPVTIDIDDLDYIKWQLNSCIVVKTDGEQIPVKESAEQVEKMIRALNKE